MKILEEVKEKYNEGREGEFRDFIVYYSKLDLGEDPEEREEIHNFCSENLSFKEMLEAIDIVMERDKLNGKKDT